MAVQGPKKQRLTVFLLKEERDAVGDILSDHAQLIHRPVAGIGDLYIRPSRTHPPGWANLFAGAVDFSKLSVAQANSAAALLLRAGNRSFALTFGYGRVLLEPGSWEERFGLRATLNSLDPKRIRSIDKQSFDSIARHSREQAGREVSAADFGLNVEQDMLRAASGSPRDPSLGSRMTGMDALYVTVKVELRNIPALLERYLAQSQSNEYKQDYPWVDQITEVEDPVRRAELDAALVESIKSGDDRVWMAVPEIIDWTDVAGFRYLPVRGALHEDLHVADFRASLRDPNALPVGTLRARKVYCFSESAGTVRTRWPVYRCLYYETDFDGSTYLLTDGKWYAINRNFVALIDAAVAALPASGLNLPNYADASESDYNQRVAESDAARYALMDEKQIQYGGGRSSIEFCDLFTSAGDIVHVKRYAGSRVLSHLFSQGLVSSELFHVDPDFRAKLNEVLPGTHQLADPAQPPSASNYHIVFGIVSRDERPLRLPFFSRVNLRFAARRLQGFGYRVYLDRIRNTLEAPPSDEAGAAE